VLTALLLGAGASRDWGCLREELNAEIVAWLTPTSLRKINSAWRSRGFGHPDEVIDDLSRRLQSSDFDYEALLGEWEAQYIEGAGDARGPSYHSLYAWLAQVVSSPCTAARYHTGGVSRWSSLLRRPGAPGQGQCTALGLFGESRRAGRMPGGPLRHSRELRIPGAHHQPALSQRPGHIVSTLRADVLCEDELADAALPFFAPGTPGINLLKLRGALDVFALGDSQNLLKLKPEAQSFDAIIDALRSPTKDCWMPDWLLIPVGDQPDSFHRSE